MKENKHSTNSEFYFELFDQFPDALVLIDSEMNIKFSNHLFKELFQSKDEVKFDEILGRFIGCRDFHPGVSNQDMNINCSNCKLKNSVKKAISTKGNQKSDTIVIQTIKNKEESLNLLQFQATYIAYEDQEYVLLKLNDLTEFGNNTVDLLTNPKKDY